jgi:hypothetical protein
MQNTVYIYIYRDRYKRSERNAISYNILPDRTLVWTSNDPASYLRRPGLFFWVKGPVTDATDAPQPWGLLWNPVMKMISAFSFFRVMEHRWNETDRGKPKYLGKNLSQYHFVHHKSHMDVVGYFVPTHKPAH